MSPFSELFLDMDSSGGHKKCQKELEVNSGCVFFPCGAVELVARCWWSLLLGVGVSVELFARCWCELSAPSVLSCPPKESTAAGETLPSWLAPANFSQRFLF